ncbi:MAG: formylglycine-generating enzyme family protein, partial [bacterium]|nr:formylglycine-generating enzyme family protein [bacterium]
YEALAYCAWAEGRLPTEAERERAARGTDNRRYPWGNEEPDSALANWNNDVGHPTLVGLYPLGNSAEGFCDLSGNVLEWVEDKWKGEAARVVRGGAWGYSDPVYLRSAVRNRFAPVDRYVDLGFRCVRELVP